MQEPNSFRDIIDRWPTAAEFARVIAGEEMTRQGRIWRRRDRVPPKYWPALKRAWIAAGHGPLPDETLVRFWWAGGGR